MLRHEIALRRRRHRVAQANGGRRADIVRLRRPEPAGIGENDSGEHIAGVVEIELVERGGEAGVQWPSPLGGGGERGAQKHDAEIGVLPDGRAGGRDRLAHARADPRARRRGDPGHADAGADLEIRDRHAVALDVPMHIAWLQRVEFGQAGGDIGVGDGAQAGSPLDTSSAMAPAMSTAATFCNPLHAGMLLTSSTRGPLRPTMTSTPAISAPTARAAARARVSSAASRGTATGVPPCLTLVIQVGARRIIVATNRPPETKQAEIAEIFGLDGLETLQIIDARRRLGRRQVVRRADEAQAFALRAEQRLQHQRSAFDLAPRQRARLLERFHGPGIGRR